MDIRFKGASTKAGRTRGAIPRVWVREDSRLDLSCGNAWRDLKFIFEVRSLIG